MGINRFPKEKPITIYHSKNKFCGLPEHDLLTWINWLYWKWPLLTVLSLMVHSTCWTKSTFWRYPPAENVFFFLHWRHIFTRSQKLRIWQHSKMLAAKASWNLRPFIYSVRVFSSSLNKSYCSLLRVTKWLDWIGNYKRITLQYM